MSANLGVSRPAVTSPTACFSVHASTDPQVLPRVLEVFAKRGMVPSQWHSIVCGKQGEELQIDIQMMGLAPAVSRLIAETLRQLYCVDVVLTSVKEAAA